MLGGSIKVAQVQGRNTSPDLNAERFEHKHTFGRIGPVPGSTGIASKAQVANQASRPASRVLNSIL